MTCTKTAEKGKTTRARADQVGIKMRQVALHHAAHIILLCGQVKYEKRKEKEGSDKWNIMKEGS